MGEKGIETVGEGRFYGEHREGCVKNNNNRNEEHIE